MAEITQYSRVLLRWWWLILLSVVAAMAASLVATRSAPLIYSSRTTIMVGEFFQDPNPNQSDFYTSQVLAQSYADLAGREPVLRGTLRALGIDWDLNTLKNKVYSRMIPGTQLIEIVVTDTDPQRAKVLVEEITNQLIQQSPAATDPENEAEKVFIQSQIEELKQNIDKARDDLVKLQDIISNASSARQIQDARVRQAALQEQITTWRSTYAQLLAATQRGTPNSLRVVEAPEVPTGPIGQNTNSNVLLAAGVGLALAVATAFVLEFIDDTIKTEEDVRATLDLPALGTIVRIAGHDYRSKVVTNSRLSADVAENYRLLRTNLQYVGVDKPISTLMITSSKPLEGKSLTAANLAVVMAQSGQRVILVDADLRRPSQHQIFAQENVFGLTTLLVNPDARPNQVLKTIPGIDNLRVLVSGPTPPNPSDLIGSSRMGQVIEALKAEADIVIFDTPPIVAVSDAAILGPRLDTTLFVVQAGRTRRAMAKRCKGILDDLGAHIAGVCLNGLPPRQMRMYTNFGYYYHRRGSSLATPRKNTARTP